MRDGLRGKGKVTERERETLRDEALRKAKTEGGRDGEMTDEDIEMTSYTGSGNEYNFNEVSPPPLLFPLLIYLFFLPPSCFSVTSTLSFSCLKR